MMMLAALALPLAVFLQAGPAAPVTAPAEVEMPELEIAEADRQSARALPLSQIVLVAAKRPQALREVAASVSLVNAEAIDEYDLKSLSEILDQQAGFFSTNNHDTNYFGVRGLSLRGDVGARLLVLVDGHAMNEAWSNSYYTEAFGLDASLIERVEILRGPTSALYGSLGFVGIVNVVTKRGRADRWVEARAELRDVRELRGTVNASHRFGNGTELLLSLSGHDNPGRERYYVERDAVRNPELRPESCTAGMPDLPGTCNSTGRASAKADASRGSTVFARAAHGAFTLHGQYGYWEKKLPMAPYLTRFDDESNADPRSSYLLTRGWLEGRFDKAVVPDALSLSVRAYYDQSRYNDDLAYADEGLAANRQLFHDDGDADWFGGELQAGITVIRREHLVDELTLGGELTRVLTFNRSGYAGEYPDAQIDKNVTMGSVYAQNELTLGERQVLLLFGVRGDFNDAFKSEVSPRAALIAQPYAAGTYKFVYSHGFINPSVYNAFFDDQISIAQNPDLRPERADNYEVIYQHAIGRSGAVSASGFYSRYRDLLVQQSICTDENLPVVICPDADRRQQFQNVLSVSSYGLEVMAEAQLGNHLRGYANYTYAIAERDDQVRLTASPRHVLHLGASVPLARRRVFISPELRVIGSRELFEVDPAPGMGAAGVPAQADAYAIANLAVVVHDLPFRGLRLSAKVTNLFDVKRVDAVLAEDVSPIQHFVHPGISAYLTAGYSY
jgi:iron complex outermembrane receptor protein